MIKGGCGENMNWFIVTSKRGIKNVIKNAVTNRNEERIKKKLEMKLTRQFYCMIYNEVLWDLKQEMILNLMLLKKIKRKFIK